MGSQKQSSASGPTRRKTVPARSRWRLNLDNHSWPSRFDRGCLLAVFRSCVLLGDGDDLGRGQVVPETVPDLGFQVGVLSSQFRA